MGIFVKVCMGRWEILEYVGEALVFIGVVGEVFAEWREPERKKLAKVSSLVLIIGLALSLAALIRTNEYFNDTIASLNGQAADSSQKASEANERAAKATLDADRLRVRAEELEEQIAEQGPRDLLLYGKREEDFTNAIRGFRGQKIQVRRCEFNNNEVRDTAERLTTIFKNAEWIVSPNSPDWGDSNCLIVRPSEPIPSGIWIGTPNPHPTPRTRERAEKLVRIFGRVPLAATLHFVRTATARASESRESILGEYGDTDGIVVVILGNPSKVTSSASPLTTAPKQ